MNFNKINKEYSEYKKNRKKIDFEYKKLEVNKNFNKIKKIKNNKKKLIVVPYRNRELHLKEFLNYMDNYFKNNTEFQILVVEQYDDKPFNRGLLLNIGSKYGIDTSFDYIIHHDVDLLPNEEMKPYYLYQDIKFPIHLGWRWKRVYNFNSYLGGVISFPKKTFEIINGYPNNFWGWGGEDDSLYNRIATNNINVIRPNTGNYTDLIHNAPYRKDKKQSLIKRDNILKDLKDWKKNGFNNVQNTYKFINIETLNTKNIISHLLKVKLE